MSRFETQMNKITILTGDAKTHVTVYTVINQ